MDFFGSTFYYFLVAKKKTTEEFIKDGIARFGSKFDYSESIYINAVTPIKIKCKKHGYLSSKMTPNKHLRRDGGCMDCRFEKAQKRYVMPLNEFLEKAKSIHPTLDFSGNKQFKNQHESIFYTCSICNKSRSTNPNRVLTGRGCGTPSCRNKKQADIIRLSLPDVIKKANAVHLEGHYSYKKSKYKGARYLMNIHCNYCNKEFDQTPDAHINQSQGCPTCGEHIKYFGDYLHNIIAKKIFIEGWLYVINIYSDTESFFKIGISRRGVKRRFGGVHLPDEYDYDTICELPIGMVDGYLQEQFILKEYKNYKYSPDIYFAGHSECLSVNPLELDSTLAEIASHFNAH